MAIQFNPSALSRFSNVDFGNDDAIANLGQGDGLVQKKELGSVFLRMFRLPGTRNRNNAVRTELLKALGQAFSIDGVTTGKGGKTKFSDGFMRRLEEVLGPEAFRRGDFGIKNGVVDSGKPLTQRRITAIVNAARAKGAAAVDGQMAAGPEREEPSYITDRPKHIKQKFMSFYNARLDEFEKNGGPSKAELDKVLSSLFNEVKGTSRTVLAELIVNGKIAIQCEDGMLPDGERLSLLVKDVKKMLSSIKRFYSNEAIYNIVLNTVKTADGTLAPEDVDVSSEDLEDLREAAGSVDLSELLSAEGDAETLGRKLGEFKRKVYAEFDSKFPDEKSKFSATKTAIMKNIFMHHAITQNGIGYASFNGIVSGLRAHYDGLAKNRETRELLDLIVPSLERASNETIVKDRQNR